MQGLSRTSLQTPIAPQQTQDSEKIKAKQSSNDKATIAKTETQNKLFQQKVKQGQNATDSIRAITNPNQESIDSIPQSQLDNEALKLSTGLNQEISEVEDKLKSLTPKSGGVTSESLQTGRGNLKTISQHAVLNLGDISSESTTKESSVSRKIGSEVGGTSLDRDRLPGAEGTIDIVGHSSDGGMKIEGKSPQQLAKLLKDKYGLQQIKTINLVSCESEQYKAEFQQALSELGLEVGTVEGAKGKVAVDRATGQMLDGSEVGDLAEVAGHDGELGILPRAISTKIDQVSTVIDVTKHKGLSTIGRKVFDHNKNSYAELNRLNGDGTFLANDDMATRMINEYAEIIPPPAPPPDDTKSSKQKDAKTELAETLHTVANHTSSVVGKISDTVVEEKANELLNQVSENLDLGLVTTQFTGTLHIAGHVVECAHAKDSFTQASALEKEAKALLANPANRPINLVEAEANAKLRQAKKLRQEGLSEVVNAANSISSTAKDMGEALADALGHEAMGQILGEAAGPLKIMTGIYHTAESGFRLNVGMKRSDRARKLETLLKEPENMFATKDNAKLITAMFSEAGLIEQQTSLETRKDKAQTSYINSALQILGKDKFTKIDQELKFNMKGRTDKDFHLQQRDQTKVIKILNQEIRAELQNNPGGEEGKMMFESIVGQSHDWLQSSRELAQASPDITTEKTKMAKHKENLSRVGQVGTYLSKVKEVAQLDEEINSLGQQISSLSSSGGKTKEIQVKLAAKLKAHSEAQQGLEKEKEQFQQDLTKMGIEQSVDEYVKPFKDCMDDARVISNYVKRHQGLKENAFKTMQHATSTTGAVLTTVAVLGGISAMGPAGPAIGGAILLSSAAFALHQGSKQASLEDLNEDIQVLEEKSSATLQKLKSIKEIHQKTSEMSDDPNLDDSLKSLSAKIQENKETLSDDKLDQAIQSQETHLKSVQALQLRKSAEAGMEKMVAMIDSKDENGMPTPQATLAYMMLVGVMHQNPDNVDKEATVNKMKNQS